MRPRDAWLGAEMARIWKLYERSGEAFELVARTHGVVFHGKTRRKVLLKMIAILACRKNRLETAGTGSPQTKSEEVG